MSRKDDPIAIHVIAIMALVVVLLGWWMMVTQASDPLDRLPKTHSDVVMAAKNSAMRSGAGPYVLTESTFGLYGGGPGNQLRQYELVVPMRFESVEHCAALTHVETSMTGTGELEITPIEVALWKARPENSGTPNAIFKYGDALQYSCDVNVRQSFTFYTDKDWDGVADDVNQCAGEACTEASEHIPYDEIIGAFHQYFYGG